LLPDLSLIAHFTAAYDSYDAATYSPRGPGDPVSKPHQLQFALQEVELALQAVVDPYARADVFLSIDEGGISVEEAYLTALTLPMGLQMRAGQLKAPLGRENTLHSHNWEFADAPLALRRLLAADQLAGPGIELSWLAPLPWYVELKLDAQSLKPGFEEGSRPGATAHLSQFFAPSDALSIAFGLSGARLSDPGEGMWRDLYGSDLYVKFRPPEGRAFVSLQAEVYARRLIAPASDDLVWGSFCQLAWRPSPYWSAAARFDDAPQDAGRERRVEAALSFIPSEFQRLRFQYAYTMLPGDRIGHELVAQLEFSIGAHGAHPF
jgi:hypothetical protein